MNMKELSSLKLGMEKDEAMGALSTEPLDSLDSDVDGIRYQSFYYLCKTGVRTHHNGGSFGGSQDSYPVVHYWMSFQDNKLVCKGPLRKYLIHETESKRKIGSSIESRKGKMDGSSIYFR